MAVTRFRNSGLRVGNTKYDSMLGGYPGLMAAPTATAGVESASVAFTARSGISTYRVISTPGSITATGTSSPISVTGLTGGTAYTFQIRGENAVGNGAYSAASNSVTPTLNTAFESIATVSASGTNTVTFSSIPSSFRHLQVRYIAQNPDIPVMRMRFNSDSSSNYAEHQLDTNGSSSSFGGNASMTSIGLSSISDGGFFTVGIIDIHDYASTTKNKTIRGFSGRDMNGSGNVYLRSGVWLNTAAISSITFIGPTSNYTANSSFALYGIKG